MNKLISVIGIFASLSVLGLLAGISSSLIADTSGVMLWDKISVGCYILCLMSLAVAVVAGIWYSILDR